MNDASCAILNNQTRKLNKIEIIRNIIKKKRSRPQILLHKIPDGRNDDILTKDERERVARELWEYRHPKTLWLTIHNAA